MSKFQIIFLFVFAFFIIGGLVLFSMYRNTSSDGPPVMMWGTMKHSLASAYINEVIQSTKSKTKIIYIEKQSSTFDEEFLEALATGRGPDAVLLSNDQIFRQQNKLIRIPYSSLSERDFKSAYVQAAEVYLNPEGIVALPLLVDPLVMYWNRDIFTNANIPLPPKTWDEFRTLASQLTLRDAAQNIIQSAVGLGEFRNITNAKEILSLLIMQAGNPITVRNQYGIQSVLDQSFNRSVPPTDSAITFYTQFADPLKQVYSWNRAMPESKQLFISNKLGVYFGFASELQEIRQKNPNLNFDIALVPQSKPREGEQIVRSTYGKMYGFAITRSTPNAAGVLRAINLLLAADSLTRWTKQTGLPSVRRDLLTDNPSDAASSVFATSVLTARTWIDPDGLGTTELFKNMVEGITSGRLVHSEAILQAHYELQNLLNAHVNKE